MMKGFLESLAIVLLCLLLAVFLLDRFLFPGDARLFWEQTIGVFSAICVYRHRFSEKFIENPVFTTGVILMLCLTCGVLPWLEAPIHALLFLLSFLLVMLIGVRKTEERLAAPSAGQTAAKRSVGA